MPFLLCYVGAYQGWLNPNQAVPKDLFTTKKSEQHEGFVTDLYEPELKLNDHPTIPAANFKRNLNGLNTPSLEGGVGSVPAMEHTLTGYEKQKWSSQQLKDVRYKPSSLKPAPVFGEFNNQIPPMFIDHDPNIKSAVEAVVYIQAEVRTVQQLYRHEDVYGTRYDPRNDPAWHRRADQSEYQVMKVVKYTEAVQYPVKSINELNLVDSKNEKIDQDYLDTMISYLNGRRFIPGSDFGARTSRGQMIKGQRNITEDRAKGYGKLPEDIRREQNRALHSLGSVYDFISRLKYFFLLKYKLQKYIF